ncbi:MAG: tetratricopeptide repeat protein, partial [Myxococcales bacterium]
APADPRINAALGNVQRRQGNEFSATNAYDTALRYERNHAEALLGFALMHIESDRPEARSKAKEFLEKLTSPTMDPPPSSRQLALARMAKAIVLDFEAKKDEADRLEAQALEADPKNSELHILKSRRLARAGKQDEAIAAVREAIRLEPKRASFYVELAGALVKKPGGAKEAVESMQQALKTMPGSPKLLVLLGDAYRAAKDYDNARAQYEKALTEAKDKLPEARMALADLAHAKKEYPRAIELYERAINEYLTATDKQAYAYCELGKIAEAQEDRVKALEHYKKAASIDQMYAPAYYLIGRMFIGDKDKAKRDQALKLYAEYLKLAPKGEYADEAQKALK